MSHINAISGDSSQSNLLNAHAETGNDAYYIRQLSDVACSGDRTWFIKLVCGSCRKYCLSAYTRQNASDNPLLIFGSKQVMFRLID